MPHIMTSAHCYAGSISAARGICLADEQIFGHGNWFGWADATTPRRCARARQLLFDVHDSERSSSDHSGSVVWRMDRYLRSRRHGRDYYLWRIEGLERGQRRTHTTEGSSF